MMYTPQVFDPKFGVVKPEGSLGLIYLASALRDKGFKVNLLDASVGNEKYSLDETFYREEKQESGMVRVGMKINEIVKEIRDFDVIGITSIFTAQTRMVEEVVSAIKENYPDKIILLGGVNARSQMQRFFRSGADLICLSEAEETIVEIGEVLRLGSKDFSNISGLAGKAGFVNPQINTTLNLNIEYKIIIRNINQDV